MENGSNGKLTRIESSGVDLHVPLPNGNSVYAHFETAPTDADITVLIEHLYLVRKHTVVDRVPLRRIELTPENRSTVKTNVERRGQRHHGQLQAGQKHPKWTSSEEARLRELCERVPEVSTSEIATQLNRSYHAVYEKIRQIGLRPRKQVNGHSKLDDAIHGLTQTH